jgi:hypothetical protein
VGMWLWLWLTLSWTSEWALLIVAIARDMGVFHAHELAVYIDSRKIISMATQTQTPPVVCVCVCVCVFFFFKNIWHLTIQTKTGI